MPNRYSRRFDRLVASLRAKGWVVEVNASEHSAMAKHGTEHWYQTPYWLNFSYSDKYGFMAGNLFSPKNSARRRIDRKLRSWAAVEREGRIHGPVQ